MLKKIIKDVAVWTMPAGIVGMARRLRELHPAKNFLCRPNVRLKGAHPGERCFVFCNGPSIKKQDIMPLKSEVVFSVSSGYHHKDYLAIQPRYHCLPRVCYTGYFNTENTVAWFKEMHSGIGNAELFLDVAEAPLVNKLGLFPGRKINYIYSGFRQNVSNSKVIDISKMVPEIGTAPVLCMIIAMYMGFKDIYLLGVDNDYWKTGEYKYFFEQTMMKETNESIFPDGSLRHPLYAQFLGFGSLLKQYNMLHNIARANNISIFNATEGGALEEFPRVKYESLF